MELTEQERRIIQALREIDDAPFISKIENFILRFSSAYNDKKKNEKHTVVQLFD